MKRAASDMQKENPRYVLLTGDPAFIDGLRKGGVRFLHRSRLSLGVGRQ